LKILDKYIIKEFLKFVGITFISLIILFLIVDFFEKIRMFLGNHATTVKMASYFIFSLPMIISYMLPPSILIATLLTYSSLSKHSEITAMKANGISLYRMSIPPLIFAVFVSIFSFFFNELITPASIQKTEHIIIVDIQKQKTFGFFQQNEIWYRSDKAFYNFKMFDINSDILRGVTINYLNSDFSLKMRLDAKEVEWKNNQWVFHNLLTTSFDENNAPVLEWSKEKIINLPEKPNDFKIIQKDAEKMGYFELKKYVKKIQTEGYDVQRYLVDLQGKIAVSLVTIILVVIGVSFSLRSERSGGTMQSLGIGIIVGFSYFVVHAFCMTLGKSGTLPSVLAAWAANILFSAVAAILFYRVRT
jgi:lipopolysaccharide export system permease protein